MELGRLLGGDLLAPIDASAILSDAKYWTRNSTPAMTAIDTAPTPAANSTPIRMT